MAFSRTSELDSKLHVLKLLSLQIESMDDPDDMRECVRGMIRFYKAEMDELRRASENTDEEAEE